MAQNEIGIRLTLSGQNDVSTGLSNITRGMDQAAAATQKVGVSAAQTAAALRGVPAQFTDIITSLQGGQSPLTVLLQQGGQLKDMFGGVGNAARALGGYMLGLINPVSATAAAVGVLGYAYLQGAKEAQEYAKALILTGNAAGTTVAQLQGMAVRVAQATGATTGAAAQALTAMATNGSISSANFEKFAAVALRVQKETGVAVEETAKQFAELGKDPLSASIKLNESTHNLTLSVYEQIKALDEQGKTAEAAAIAQNNAADVSTQRMKELEANLGTVERAWRKVADSAREGWDKVLNIGRTDNTDDLKQKIAELKQNASPSGDSMFPGLKTYGTSERDKAALKFYEEQLAYKEHIKASNDDFAKFQAEQNALTADKIKWDKTGLEFASEEYKLKVAINKATEENNRLLAAGAITPEQASQRLADISSKSPLAKTSLDQRIAYYEQINSVTQSGEKRALETLTSMHAAQLVSDVDYIEKKQELSLKANAASVRMVTSEIAAVNASGIAQKDKIEAVAKYNSELVKLKEQEKDIRAATANEIRASEDKANREYIKSYADTIESEQKKVDSINALVEKERLHVESIGKTKEAVADLEAAELLKQATSLDGLAIYADEQLMSKGLADSYRDQAKAKRELANLKQVGGAKQASEDARKEWQKAADKIGDHLTDALMRGFESGKGFAENLRDTVANMFKTLVLRPTVSAVVNPLTQGITGAMGLSGAANAAGAANALTSAGTFAAGISAFGGTLATGFMNTLLGSGLSGGLSAAGAMIANGAWASGLGMAAGALGPLALGVVALSALSDHGTPTANTGNASAAYDRLGNRTDYQTFYGGSSEGVDKMLASLQDSYAKAAKTLGIGAAATQFSYGGNTGKNGESPNFALGGGAGSSRFYQGETSSSDAAIQLAASRAVFAALQGSDLPQYLAKMFDGLSASAMSQEQIANTLAYAQSVKQVRDALLETREPLQILKDNVAQGFTALATSADTFKTDFVAAIDNGITPEKLAQWQGLQTAMTELAAASGKASDAVKEVGRSIADIANERQRLQDQLDELTMTSAQLLEKQRNAVDSSNRSLFDQVQAAFRAKAAIDNLNQAMTDLASANSALESARRDVASTFKAIQDAAANAANAVGTAKGNITNGYLAAQEAVANAQARVIEVLNQSATALSNFSSTLGQFLLRLTTTDLGANSKGQQFAALQADFAITSASARAGDVGALGSLTGKAESLLSAGKDQSATELDFARLVARVSSTLSDIAAQAGPQAASADPAVKAQQDLASAQAELAKWSNAAAVSGASTAKATTDYLTEWRAATAANAIAQADLLAATNAAQGIDTSGPSAIDSLTAAIAGFTLSLSAQLRALSTTLAAMRVNGTGGAVSGAGTYTGTQALDAIRSAYAAGDSTPQIINAANVNLGVSSADLAKIADVAGYTEISAYQKRIDNTAELSADKVQSIAAQAVQLAQTNGTSGEIEFIKYVKSLGWNAGMADKAMGWPGGTTNAWATANGLPAFRVGTNYVPRDMVAQLHEGEMVVPKPYNPAAGGMRDMARLESLVERLTAEVEGLRTEARATATNTNKTAKMLDRAMPAGDAISTRAVA